MHDQLLAYAIQLAVDPPDPNAVKVTALTLAGTVVATAGTVFLALRSPREERANRRESRGPDAQYHAALKAQLAGAEKRAREAIEQRDKAQARVGAYERWLWLHHIDPRKITTGDEVADSVRI